MKLRGEETKGLRMSKIYKNADEFYKMIKPVGSWPFSPRYALWRPVKKFLWFWISNGKKEFWLDMYGFEKIERTKKLAKQGN